MTTTKPRINISVSDETRRILIRLAQRDNMPEATKAVRLIELALELEEDIALDQIAEKRDTKRAHFISHSKAWKL